MYDNLASIEDLVEQARLVSKLTDDELEEALRLMDPGESPDSPGDLPKGHPDRKPWDDWYVAMQRHNVFTREKDAREEINPYARFTERYDCFCGDNEIENIDQARKLVERSGEDIDPEILMYQIASEWLDNQGDEHMEGWMFSDFCENEGWWGNHKEYGEDIEKAEILQRFHNAGITITYEVDRGSTPFTMTTVDFYDIMCQVGYNYKWAAKNFGVDPLALAVYNSASHRQWKLKLEERHKKEREEIGTQAIYEAVEMYRAFYDKDDEHMRKTAKAMIKACEEYLNR